MKRISADAESYKKDHYLKGAILGTLAAVGIAAVTQVQVPIVLGGVLFLGLGLFLIAVMPETGFKRPEGEYSRAWTAMFGTFRDGVRLVRMKPVLVTILVT